MMIHSMHIQLHKAMLLQQHMNKVHPRIRMHAWVNRFLAFIAIALITYTLACPSPRLPLLDVFTVAVNCVNLCFIIVPHEQRWMKWCRERDELTLQIAAMRDIISHLHGHLL